jgi:type IX secretion system PorP/SprF family membrane protein
MFARLVLLIVIVFSFVESYSQQDPVFSQTRSWLNLINPGAAGSNDRICLNAAHREQWVGFPGAPSTSFFSAEAPFSFLGADHGAALSILNDAAGFYGDLGLQLSYAYRLDLGKGKLGIGINGGVLNKSINDPEWRGSSDGDISGDPLIPQTSDSQLGFDMGFGVFYNTENLFLGISTTHLNQARIRTENASIYLVRHYYITAGYTLQLANPMFEVMPSFLISSDGRVNQLYVNGHIRYNKRIWGGVSYRTNEAIVGLFGIELFSGIRVGYSYDISTSRLINYSGGSHELTIGYCFDLSLDKTPQKYKSIRFL